MTSITENGALTYENFSNELINAWFKLARNSPFYQVEELIMEAHNKDKLNTWKMICAFRNFRDIGKGERELFINCLKVMAKNDPNNLINNLDILMEQGRLDDFYKLGNHFINNIIEKTISPNELLVFEKIVIFYAKQFQKDKEAMLEKGSVSLLAKWADHQKKGIGMSIIITYYLRLLDFSKNTLNYFGVSLDSFASLTEFLFNKMKMPKEKTTNVALDTLIVKEFKKENEPITNNHEKIMKSVNYALGEFRKQYLSPLNKYIHTLEIQMCDKTFNLTDKNIQHLPALAVKKYQKYFSRNFPETYLDICKKIISGELKLKGVSIDLANFAKEYLNNDSSINPIIEGQFESLLEHTFSHMITNIESGNEFVVSCPVSDISGSMLTNNKGVIPLCICALMSIITMKLNILANYEVLKEYTARDLVHMVMGKMEVPEMSIPFYATHGISFSETPQFYEIPLSTNSLHECMTLFMKQPVGYSTNFYSVFNLIKQLKVVDNHSYPSRCIAFTDGQFDMQTANPLLTTMEAINKLFDGEPPELVYWNISSTAEHKTTDHKDDVVGFSALSGYNPNLTQVILFNEKKKEGEKTKMTPTDVLRRILEHKAFSGIKVD